MPIAQDPANVRRAQAAARRRATGQRPPKKAKTPRRPPKTTRPTPRARGGASAFVPATAYEDQYSRNIAEYNKGFSVRNNGKFRNFSEDGLNYLKTIFNPEAVCLAGIPDRFALPTSLLKLTTRLPFSTDASGAFLLQVKPAINSLFFTYASAAGLWGAPTDHPCGQITQVQPTILQYRPVSMSLKFIGTQSLTAAAGQVLIGVCQTSANLFFNQPVSDVQQGLVYWKNCSMASAVDDGCRVIWFPRDPQDNVFLGSLTAPIGGGANTLGQPGITQHDYNSLVLAIIGAAANTAIGQIEINLNIEAIPNYGDNFLPRKPTLADESAMVAVSHAAATINPIQEKPPSQMKKDDPGFDFNSLFNTIGKVVSPIAGLLSLL
jgi:hypothetical protein